MASDTYHVMKVVMLGQSNVGKSSLVLRFVQEKFFPNTEGTIGAAFLTKVVDLQEEEDEQGTKGGGDGAHYLPHARAQPKSGRRSARVKFELWDTAGQERYHSLAPMYYRGAHAALLVYDITSRETFERAKQWADELETKAGGNQLCVLVGNKCDLEDNRALSYDECRKYAEERGMLHYETSAKDGSNVGEIFMTLAHKLPKDHTTLRPDSVLVEGEELSAPTKKPCAC